MGQQASSKILSKAALRSACQRVEACFGRLWMGESGALGERLELDDARIHVVVVVTMRLRKSALTQLECPMRSAPSYSWITDYS